MYGCRFCRRYFIAGNGKVAVEKKYVWKAIKGMNIYFMFTRMDGGGVISA